jgi:hypothetical protein
MYTNFEINWEQQHARGVENNRIPKQFIAYMTSGKRRLGRRLKRWHATVTGHMT